MIGMGKYNNLGKMYMYKGMGKYNNLGKMYMNVMFYIIFIK